MIAILSITCLWSGDTIIAELLKYSVFYDRDTPINLGLLW